MFWIRFLFCLLSLFFLDACQQKNLPRSSTSIQTHALRAVAQASGPRILCIVAHPDDEIAFAATLYKNTTFLNGICDIVLITNGEGGFKYATLAESIYGKNLTEEDVGRKYLPEIRQKEFLEGCKIMQIRQVFLLNQKDHHYTTNPNEVLGAEAHIWDLKFVREALSQIVSYGQYDFILTHLPEEGTHGHHKAATLLALETVENLNIVERPVILGVKSSRKEQTEAVFFQELSGFPKTQVYPKPFFLDRTQPFGYQDRLNYKIIVNWVIAEHKSQGTMQLFMNEGDIENYFVYSLNPKEALEKTALFFEQLKQKQFIRKEYSSFSGQTRPLKK